MAEFDKEAAETIDKLSSHVRSLDKDLRITNRALDIALTKLAEYEHYDECQKIATELSRKGYISTDDVSKEADKLYNKKVSELKGIKDTLAHMGQSMPSWGNLDGDVNVKEAGDMNSSEALDGIVQLLREKI